MRKPLGSAIAEGALLGCIVLASAYIFSLKAKAYEPKCDWEAAFNLLAADKRFGKPITATGPTAMQLAAAADLVPSKQAMIVPFFGPTREQLKFIVLTCGPNETWTPRHFVIDTEAERRFYNLAPPPAADEAPKQKNRTRRANQ